MAKQNPYDAPAIPAMKGPPADDHTEVSLSDKRTKSVLPVDDETNFGDLDAVIGSTTAQIDDSLLSVDPRALAARLAESSPPEIADPLPLPAKRQLEEDEPTLLGGSATGLDPKELARELAAQAKARIAKQQAKDDPVALAKRLAAEAKARIAKSEKRKAKKPAAEDPAALAKRLAKEAKARLTPGPAPARKSPPKPPKASKARKAKGSLASRAPRKKAKKNALEALQSYTEPSPEPIGRRVATPTPPPMRASEILAAVHSESPSTPAPAPSRAAAPVAPAPAKPAPAPQAPAPVPTHLAVIQALLPNATIESERPVRRPNVFTALWAAHQARAVKDGQLALAGAAALLLGQASRLPAGQLIGVKLTHDGKGWAAFVDRDSGELLAIVPRPEIYLAGLQ